MSQKIVVSVKGDGNLHVEYEGFVGNACFDEADKLSRALTALGLDLDIVRIQPTKISMISLPEHRRLKNLITDRYSRTTEQRLWEKVIKTDTCWLWTGGVQGDGYGTFRERSGADKGVVLAHRFVYEFLVGPIPQGEELHHICENKRCVRPLDGHVSPVTRQEHRALDKSYLVGSDFNRKKTHCPRGHAYDEENTHITIRQDGRHRGCRACGREKKREQYRARVAMCNKKVTP